MKIEGNLGFVPSTFAIRIVIPILQIQHAFKKLWNEKVAVTPEDQCIFCEDSKKQLSKTTTEATSKTIYLIKTNSTSDATKKKLSIIKNELDALHFSTNYHKFCLIAVWKQIISIEEGEEPIQIMQFYEWEFNVNFSFLNKYLIVMAVVKLLSDSWFPMTCYLTMIRALKWHSFYFDFMVVVDSKTSYIKVN